jgi:hypothetical protein
MRGWRQGEGSGVKMWSILGVFCRLACWGVRMLLRLGTYRLGKRERGLVLRTRKLTLVVVLSRFNPIAPTLLRKALQTLLYLHFSSASSRQKQKQPPKDILDMIVDSSNGDIRSAIMALQFACIVELPRTGTTNVSKGKSKDTTKQKGKKKGDGVVGEVKAGGAKVILEAITRRESSLALFHLMGKVLYNKREFWGRSLSFSLYSCWISLC